MYVYYKYIHARSSRAYTSVPIGATAADNIIVVEGRYGSSIQYYTLYLRAEVNGKPRRDDERDA